VFTHTLTNWLHTHSKIGISHAVFSWSWFAFAAAEVTETTEAAAEIAASDGSTEQEQCLHNNSLVNFYSVSQKTSPTFLAVTLESIVGFS